MPTIPAPITMASAFMLPASAGNLILAFVPSSQGEDSFVLTASAIASPLIFQPVSMAISAVEFLTVQQIGESPPI